MSAEYLGTAGKAKLLDCLFDANQTLEDIGKQFQQSFTPTQYVSVCNEFKNLFQDLIAVCEGVALISSLYVVNTMRKAECVPAYSVFYDVLIELEKGIKNDIFLSEQLRYSSNKESKENKKSFEATFGDSYRMHSAAKLFAINLLTDSITITDKPSTFLSMKQEDIDTELDNWEKGSAKVKEPLAQVSQAWTTEHSKNTTGSLNEAAAVFHRHSVVKASLNLQKSLAPAKLPLMPLTVGEIKYLLPGSTDVFVLGEAHSADWSAAKKLLDAATVNPLPVADKEKLTELLKNESVSKNVGINATLLVTLASVSPDVCAIALNAVASSVASSFIQILIATKMPCGKLEEVLLHVPKLLTQSDVRVYISEKIREFKGKPSLSEEEKASFKAFANFLYELMTKKASENKEIFIADALKPDVEELLKSSDYKSQWDEMKK